jgi:truncated hemoglobin YjbI
LLGGTKKLNQLIDSQYANIETHNYLQALFNILIQIRNSIELAGLNN